MATFQDAVDMLTSMGFEDETEIRRALALSGSNVSEAVARLTSSSVDSLPPRSSPYYRQTNSSDIEMQDVPSPRRDEETAGMAYTATAAAAGSSATNGLDYQSSYSYAHKSQSPRKNPPGATTSSSGLSSGSGGGGTAKGAVSDDEFPETHLYELESRLQAETWSVPIGANESLAVCLVAAASFARKGLADKNKGCAQFQEFALYSALEKLHTSFMVCRWGAEVQGSIFQLTVMLVHFISERVRHLPVPVKLLGLLTLVFDPESEFHYKNKAKPLRQQLALGPDEVYAKSPYSTKEACNWLVAIINCFGGNGGVHTILKKIEDEKLDMTEFSALLAPFGKCAEFLVTPRMKRLLKPTVDKAHVFISSLTEEDFKNKDVGHVSELFSTLKSFSFYIQVGAPIADVEALRLETSLRMLKTAHFNAKMNALKEIEKLVGEAQRSRRHYGDSISSSRLLQWMVENDVLAIALGGNLHQAQYCERLKKMMEILAPKLTKEKLTKIWNMQTGMHPVVAENIHSIMAAASVKFSTEQLDHLFDLIQQNWSSASDRIREKLVAFVGKIGQADTKGTMATKVLDLLWQLAHLRGLPPEMVKEALDSHIKILSTSTSIKDELRKVYGLKCIDNIKKGVSILPSLRHLHEILVGLKSSLQYSEKSLISELQKQQEIIKMAVVSLVRCHREAVAVAGIGKLSIDGIVIGKYTHGDFVNAHLDFLAYILNAGCLYLSLARAKDIWDTLAVNAEVCDEEREICFDWFVKGMQDMDPSTQREMFEQKVLQFNTSKLTLKGYSCFKAFFEHVNTSCRKMNGSGTNFPTVEQQDLIGLNYLWQVALDSPSVELAHNAIDHLMHVLYLSTSPRLKSKPRELHTGFIRECYRRLQDAVSSLDSLTPVEHAISAATTMAAAPSSPTAAEASASSLADRFGRLRVIERLLLLAETYIQEVESYVTSSRRYPPHGSTFQGSPLELEIISDCSTNRVFFVKTNSNETLISLRRKIAIKMKCSLDVLQVYYGDKMLLRKQDYMLLRQLNLKNETFVSAKSGSTFFSTKRDQTSSGYVPPARRLHALEYEKQYPSVLMQEDADLFNRLYRFAEMDNALISSRVRNLLLLLPADPTVVQAIDSLLVQGQTSSASKTPCENDIDADEVLKELFTYHESLVSAFQTLYNLEVLSGRLMPTSEGVTARFSMEFKEAFLAVDGHRYVVDILRQASAPSSVSPEVRLACVGVALKVARYLLCGSKETVVHAAAAAAVSAEDLESCEPEMFKEDYSSCPVMTMNDDEFLGVVTCMLDVARVAATGQFSNEEEAKDGVLENEKMSDIAVMALELFVSCFEIRARSIDVFFKLPDMDNNIVKFLVESPFREVREGAVKQFYRLSEVHGSDCEGVNNGLGSPVAKRQRINGEMTSRKFLLQTLMRAPLPLWTLAGKVRGSKKKTLERCSEYFELRCRLLHNLTIEDQAYLGVKPGQMLEHEVSWLDSTISSSHCPEELLAGHLNLIETLLTCSTVDKRKFKPDFVSELLDVFLFPAATLRLAGGLPGHTISPKCREKKSRQAALNLLVTLARGCPDNLEVLVKKLIPMHHHYNYEIAKQWEFQPPVAPRASCGFVGIKNGGATCYMNSVIQQLYMQPVIRNTLLALDDPEMDEESTFYQMQQLFGHLLDSQLEHYIPEHFWNVFKLWGNPVNIREQQDAFEFFTNVTDQLDEELKKYDRPQIFSKTFGGLFVDQIVCKDCPHRYERKETFWSLPLGIKSSHTLEEALQQFVKGEVLEKDNAYFCEKCGNKRDATKRMSIKALPQLLVIHLKRFGYNWEEQKALKNNEYFRFPWTIDMAPYTAEALGLGRSSPESSEFLSSVVEEKDAQEEDTQPYYMESDPDCSVTAGPLVSTSKMYELVGIVVHSGQASAGHYYSFVKDLRRDEGGDHWYKFNDTSVEEIDMDESTLETECFGGLFKSKTIDIGTVMRAKNAYMLFYKAAAQPEAAEREGRRCLPSEREDNGSEDELGELTALVQKGEKTALFPARMPVRIQRAVQDENLRFMQNRDVFNSDYFDFVYNLTLANVGFISEDSSGLLGACSSQLAVEFLCNTFFHTDRRLRRNLKEWTSLMDNLLKDSPSACQWFITFLGGHGVKHIRPLLLECPCEERRASFCQIVQVALQSYLQHGGSLMESDCDSFLEYLLSLLAKDVPDNVKACSQYMTLMCHYARLAPPQGVRHLLLKNAFLRFLAFLVGPSVVNVDLDETALQQQEGGVGEAASAAVSSSRRWTGKQLKEVIQLHSALRLMVTSCDLSPLYNFPGDVSGQTSGFNPYYFVDESELLPLPTSVRLAAFHVYRDRYIKEMLAGCREVSANIEDGIQLACCLSWCNWDYSVAFLCRILNDLTCLPSNELRPLFQILASIMLLEDPLQMKRLEYLIDSKGSQSLISIMKENSAQDGRRSYQCVKFLVHLATKSDKAASFLRNNMSRLKWAVKWLNRQMSDYYWNADFIPNVSNESSQSKSLQRTISAQDTLEEANALLKEWSGAIFSANASDKEQHPTSVDDDDESNVDAEEAKNGGDDNDDNDDDKDIDTMEQKRETNFDDVDD